MSIQYDEKQIECETESIQGYSICHQCGGKAMEFHGSDQQLRLRHLPVCGRQVILWLRPKRYRCQDCDGGPATTESPDWYDAKAGCTKAFAKFLMVEGLNNKIKVLKRRTSGITNLANLFRRIWLDLNGYEAFAN